MPATWIPGFALTDHVVEVPLDHSTFRAAPDDGRTIEVALRARSSTPTASGGLRRLADMAYTHHYNAANRSAVLPAVYLTASRASSMLTGPGRAAPRPAGCSALILRRRA